MTIPDNLAKKIESFIAIRSKSEGGYSPVSNKDIQDLSSILQSLIEAKYEEDPDGDLPISYQLIDRTKYQTSPYSPMPHTHRLGGDLNALRSALRSAQTNVNIARDNLDQVMRAIEYGVFEPMEKGLAVTVGKNTYERHNSLVDYKPLAEAAKASLEEYLTSHSLVNLSNYDEKIKWQNDASKFISEKLNSPVEITANRYSKSAGKVAVYLTLVGLGTPEKTQRGTGILVNDPFPLPKKSGPSP